MATLLPLALLLIGCGIGSLKTEGPVRLWDTRQDGELARIAGTLEGLSLSESPRDKPWARLMLERVEAPDLIFTEWGRDLYRGRVDGRLADLKPYWPRLRSARSIWSGLRQTLGDGSRPFLPAALYCWGLFYNPSALERGGLPYPESWEEFEASLGRLKESGIVPISLGSTAGWPALAWFSYIDMRLNGHEAQARLATGERAFDDPGLDRVYETLQSWRDRGWLAAQAAGANWPDSLIEVESGRAAYVLMGCFAVPRFADPETVRWAPLPPSRLKGAKRGELAVVQGFALSAEARAPAAALAYVSSGAAGSRGDAFRVSAAAGPRRKEPSAAPHKLSAIKAEEESLLRSGARLAPQLDRFLPPQAAYDANKAFVSFFAAGSTMSAAELKAAMKALVP
jgi:hypothetical protein